MCRRAAGLLEQGAQERAGVAPAHYCARRRIAAGTEECLALGKHSGGTRTAKALHGQSFWNADRGSARPRIANTEIGPK
jgi:hypothetical protein